MDISLPKRERNYSYRGHGQEREYETALVLGRLHTSHKDQKEALEKAKEAIRLGFVVAFPEEIEVNGIFGYSRPFAESENKELEEKRAKKALDRIKKDFKANK